MPDQSKQNDPVIPNGSEPFGNVPKPSEAFGTVRNDAETFGSVPKSSEAFRNVPNHSERKENHTLTVREVARMFEAAGVARTERSIVNWCQPNRTGIARLDAYFDPNERRYFIAPQSVDLAIAEEKAKAIRGGDSAETSGRSADASAPSANIPKPSEASATAQNQGDRKDEPPRQPSSENAKRIEELEKEVVDLKITNRAKDYFIERLEKDRENFAVERHGFINKLMSFTRRVGQMETRLLQLGTPKEELDAISSIEENFSDTPDQEKA